MVCRILRQIHFQEVGMMHSSGCFVLAFTNHKDIVSTSHTTLKACDHCILRDLIGRKPGDSPSSLHNDLKVKVR
jgi:hypothetical protein